jgi:PD-(D/E)XK nuclease superfamily protein
VDPSVEGLLPKIRLALDADASGPVGGAARESAAELAPLVAAVREALEKDDRLFANEDESIAKQVAAKLPQLVERVSRELADTRSRLVKEAPWALAPLDSELDLLSPLGKGRQETAHTLYLAYLMDSRRPHGLGVAVLREFFRLLGKLIPGEDSFEILSRRTEDSEQRLKAVRVSAEEIVEAEHLSADAHESRRCDIWIELVEEGRSLFVVIENKVDAGEHGDQLSAYEGAVWQRARARRHLSFDARLIFLTPDGRPPGDEADKKLWIPISYRQLAAVLVCASREAPEPGRSMLVLYTASILRKVLDIPAKAEGVDGVRQLPFMRDVLEFMTVGGSP